MCWLLIHTLCWMNMSVTARRLLWLWIICCATELTPWIVKWDGMQNISESRLLPLLQSQSKSCWSQKIWWHGTILLSLSCVVSGQADNVDSTSRPWCRYFRKITEPLHSTKPLMCYIYSQPTALCKDYLCIHVFTREICKISNSIWILTISISVLHQLGAFVCNKTVVKLRERVRERFGKGMSPKGHL